MLKQILQDMRVEPEILKGLTDTEKQTLFCIMREEQIRRWRAWDQEQAENERNSHSGAMNNEDTYNNVNIKLHANTKKKKKLGNSSVEFLIAEDGEPWVWVMGEHENDRSIEQIIAEEAQKKAIQLAEQEAKVLRKSVEAELTDIMDYRQHSDQFSLEEKRQVVKKLSDDEDSNTPIIDDLEIYCSVDELRERINGPPKITNRIVTNLSKTNKVPECNILQEISNKPQNLVKNTKKVAARVALWEQRLIAERSTEILKGIQRKQLEKVKEAEEAARSNEELWIEQERKAKQTELKIREIARKAREEHRKSLNCDQLEVTEQRIGGRNANISNSGTTISPPLSLEENTPRPPNQEAVIKWYREEELPKGAGLDESRPRKLSKWFHGILSRAEAERLLQSEPAGSFLVRISEKIWGYAISYKDHDRCKHYLVDASNGRYQFLGSNQLSHVSLKELVGYHGSHPITSVGDERLQIPCPLADGHDAIAVIFK